VIRLTRPLVLAFDLNGFVHRAFHGQPYRAARLAIGWAARAMRVHQPEFVVAAIDRPFPTFRHERFPAYKSKGRVTGDERARVLGQLREAEELLEDVLGVRTLWAEGFEADDMLATIAREANSRGFGCMIATKDKDLAQVVGSGVWLLDFMTGEIVGPDQVVERFGVPPEKMADYLALVGDSSDCYPGAPGIGPKAAVEILKFAEGALAACERSAAFSCSDPNVAGTPFARDAIRRKLAAGAADVLVSLDLARLRDDVPIVIDFEALEALPVPDEVSA
jgi:DNA polymerase-1